MLQGLCQGMEHHRSIRRFSVVGFNRGRRQGRSEVEEEERSTSSLAQAVTSKARLARGQWLFSAKTDDQGPDLPKSKGPSAHTPHQLLPRHPPVLQGSPAARRRQEPEGQLRVGETGGRSNQTITRIRQRGGRDGAGELPHVAVRVGSRVYLAVK